MVGARRAGATGPARPRWSYDYATDDQQLLAGSRVPPGRIVVHTAVVQVHAIDDGIANWSAALDDPARSCQQLANIEIERRDD